jgi:O-antigen ligase
LWQTKHRVWLGALMLLIGLGMLPVVGPAWIDRMQTIDSSEASAEGRIDAWTWAFQYVLEHPLGGGLDAYRINAPAMRAISGGTTTRAKATHSIYFEVLSETGFMGFGIWVMIVTVFYRSMYRLWKKTKGIKELEWLRYLLKMLVTSMTVFLVGGAFLSIAFIPLFYYVIVLGVCLCERHRVWQMGGQPERSLYFGSASVRTRGSAPA